MDRVEPSPVRWLWTNRVPLGKLTLLAGDPGLGKSFVTLDLAARVTTGVLPSVGSEGGDGGPGSVVVCSAEDDPADTIRPRLDRMGADPSRVFCVGGIRYQPTPDHDAREHPLRLDRDLDLIEGIIREAPSPRLVIVDPISAYMGERDSHNNAEVRSLLAALSSLAARTGVAVVCVTHLSKGGQGQKAVYRAMGSLAFTAAARVVLLAAKHPDDPSRRVLLPIKCNVGTEAKAIAYEIADGRVEWDVSPLDLDVDRLESGGVGGEGEQPGPSALEEACAWLTAALADGPRPAKALITESGEVGISLRTLQRAKAREGIPAIREDDEWKWVMRG